MFQVSKPLSLVSYSILLFHKDAPRPWIFKTVELPDIINSGWPREAWLYELTCQLGDLIQTEQTVFIQPLLPSDNILESSFTYELTPLTKKHVKST